MDSNLINFAWTGSVEPWKRIQEEVRHRLVVCPLNPLPRFVGGVDCAISRADNRIRAAAVVYDRFQKHVVDQAHVVQPLRAPYVPTYLSFREIPAILSAIEGLKAPFNALLVDGQGIAHPRRCGIATHLGVLLDLPTVGCAKSRLIGTHADPNPALGSAAVLLDKDEQIGVVLRTKLNTNPLYVSIGHRIDLPSAIALTLACCTRYRLPEPTRIADRLSKF